MESAKLFEKNLKRFDFHLFRLCKDNSYKNLWEAISRYPNHGYDSLVWRKDWPANEYFHIK